MPEMNEHDLQKYFELYETYQQTEEPKRMNELDKKLSQYKDRFHKNPEAVLGLLEEGRDDFRDKFKVPYQDLLFDLEMHAQSMEKIRKTHTFDAERDAWVPKGS